MSTLITTLGYQKGEIVKAIITATNAKGTSNPSSPNILGAVVEGTPFAPKNLFAENTTPTQIRLTWNPILTSPENGFNDVTDYKVHSNTTGTF